MAEHAADKAAAAADQPARTGTGTTRGTTRLDTDTTVPSTTAPGDGPADTMDPTERASTVGGDKAAAAAAGHGTVNAVIPLPDPAPAGPAADGEREHRVETYPARRADGSTVTVTHNIDTGETSVAAES